MANVAMDAPLQLSPMVPTGDLPITSQFLTEGFGFETSVDFGSYAILKWGDFRLHLALSEEETPSQSVYLEVVDLGEVWKRVQAFLVDGISVREPFEREYGMEEFHVVLPMTSTLLFVGQTIGS
ncbi:MAG: hypothetical protein AAF191_00345 [Verrucomicrobiota bacterium]